MAEEFDITVKHPDYEAYENRWAVMRDAIDGEDAVKAKGETYLPMKTGTRALKDAGLKKEIYADYKGRAEFPDVVAPTVNGSVGLAFDKPTQIELPKGMEDLKERATLDGLTLDGLHQRIVTEVMRCGRFGLLPGVDEDGEFYIATYTAETVRNWDETGKKLSFVVLDETAEVRDTTTNKWETKKKFRECNLVDGVYQSREWLLKRSNGDKEVYEAQEPEGATIQGKKPLDFVPFVAVGSTDLTMKPDAVPLYGLARLAIRGYRLDADYTNSLHLTSEPTPYVTGVSEDSTPGTIGAHNVWGLPEGATAGMLEFEGAGVSAQRDAILDTRERAIMFGAQLLSDTKKTAESGEALKLRLGNKHATLKSVVTTVAAGLQMALRHIAVWKAEDPEKVVVTPNLDFVDHLMSAQDISALVESWLSGAISWNTMFENFKRGEIVRRDVEADDERELIKAGLPTLTGDPLSLDA